MSRAGPARAPHKDARGERFSAAMAAIVRKLPFGLAEILPPSLVGFAVINGFTFAVDLGVLTTLRSELRWPPGKPFLNAVAHSYAANRAMDRLTWLVKN